MMQTPAEPNKYLPLLLALSIFMQMLDTTILNTALPKMALDLHESPLNMQSAVISYSLTLALLMPLSGYLCDRYGTKRVFTIALGLFVAGSLMAAAAVNLPLLVIARITQGMGGAMLMPLPRAVILRAYDKSKLLSTMNFIIMPALLGPILGPLVGGYLVEYVGWHWIFLINVPIGLLGILMSLKLMPDFRTPDGSLPHFDVLGFLLFSSSMVGISLGIELLNHPEARLFSLLCVCLGILALYAYYRHARDDKNALYPPELLHVRTFRLGILGNLISRLGMGAVPFLLPLLLQLAFGRSASFSGWTLAPIALAALLTKPLIKPVISRFGYRTVLIWNTRLIGSLIMLLSLPTADTPQWLLIPMLFTIGICNSLQYSAMNTLTLADLQSGQAGSGSSLMTVNQQLAVTLGIALGALLLNVFSTALPSGGQLTEAFDRTFWTIGSITFLSSWVFTRLHPEDGEHLIQAQK